MSFSRSFSLSPVVVALVLAAQPARASPPDDGQAGRGPWELVRDDDGIVVHRRTIDGSKLHEFRGVGIVEAPIASIIGVLEDAEHRTEWMKEAVANVRIARVGAFDEIFYSRTGAPWPVADRDVVNRASTTFDVAARQVRIEFTATTHPGWPPHKGVVRMPALRGHWYMTPEHNGAWTRIEYQLHADPGGLLPTWVVNLVSKRIPHDTLAGLRQQVKRRHYPEIDAQMAALPAYAAIVAPVVTSAANPLKKETP